MAPDQKKTYEMCLVGQFLIDVVIKFEPMQNTLVDVWRSSGGVSIKRWEPVDNCSDFFMKWTINSS